MGKNKIYSSCGLDGEFFHRIGFCVSSHPSGETVTWLDSTLRAVCHTLYIQRLERPEEIWHIALLLKRSFLLVYLFANPLLLSPSWVSPFLFLTLCFYFFPFLSLWHCKHTRAHITDCEMLKRGVFSVINVFVGGEASRDGAFSRSVTDSQDLSVCHYKHRLLY